MKIVPFTLTAEHGGKCLPACLTMITGIPFEKIPDFKEQGAAWLQNAREWLMLHGWGSLFFRREAVARNLACLGFTPGIPVLLAGPSRLGFHAVVFLDGEILDPDPGQVGIEDWEFALVLVKS